MTVPAPTHRQEHRMTEPQTPLPPAETVQERSGGGSEGSGVREGGIEALRAVPGPSKAPDLMVALRASVDAAKQRRVEREHEHCARCPIHAPLCDCRCICGAYIAAGL